MLHGFTGSPISLRPLAEALAKRGFSVELPRLPGHGTHYRDLLSTRYQDWYGEAEAALARLERRTERVVAVGLSGGGTLALDLACSEQHRLAGVATINVAILNRRGIAPKLAPLIAKFTSAAPASLAGLAKNDAAKSGVDERAYDRVPVLAGHSFERALPVLRQKLPSLRLPVLVARSRRDHSVPPENSIKLIELLRSIEDVEELVLERSFHLAPLDYDADLLESRIAAFAERVAAKTSRS
jgi:carboxylesterase